jgi:hypothetical protein
MHCLSCEKVAPFLATRGYTRTNASSIDEARKETIYEIKAAVYAVP